MLNLNLIAARGRLALALLAAMFFAHPALAIDFGDDAGEWANDGECDDPRFGGPGMTITERQSVDILHDATDCQTAFDAGRLVFGTWTDTPDAIDFGEDTSEWAKDGECDDPRFEGPGMTTTPLLDEDIRRDATDCQQAFNAARISLRLQGAASTGEVDFGDDEGQWANDGECDDPRFGGPGMTITLRQEVDLMHDATDCKTAFDAGRLVLGIWTDTPDAIDFGQDTSEWAEDGECDDPRFEGPGMTTTPLLEEDIRADATDCTQAFKAERISLRLDGPAVTTTGTAPDAAINFGDDAGQWANDGECDDPRFTGPGMTQTALLDADILHDATDCKTAFEAGNLTLAALVPATEVDFGDDASQWANDVECDDPRFRGAGMTSTPLLDSDILHDATDCRTAYEAGTITLVP